MPERLALDGARVEVRQSRTWVNQADLGQRTTVLPRDAVFVERQGLSDSLLAELADGSLTTEARLAINGSTFAAIAVLGMTRKSAWAAVHNENLGASWMSTTRGVEVMTSDRSGLPERKPDGSIVGGRRLAEVLGHNGVDASVTPTWASAQESGWVKGGELGAACPQCNRPLEWFDWQHADAVARRHTAFVLCAAHGPIRLPASDILLATRRDLDTGLACARSESLRQVYVFDVTGPGLANAVYVGESWHQPPVRRQKHIDGDMRAAALNRPGLVIGGLRPDLVPDFPPLFGAVSLYAERWLAEVLRRRGFHVLGGH
ncbi:hypothetical protein [Cellulomonas sp. Leaf395]|uniref:hypothetical protein n=1 Tax=Cellulomonas sp. Leaf395 TaxID=1736362 RepID=UPI0012F87B7F|nr:hypothetical protein [Cellulomonas sp. Leaf395]